MESSRLESGKPARPAYRSFRLAEFDEMWRQLEDLHKPGSAQEQFLEVMLEKADTEVTGVDLSMALAQDIGEFVEANQLPDVVSTLMFNEVPRYLKALIPDPDVLADSLSIWEEIIIKVKYEDSQRDPVPGKLPRKLKKAYYKPEYARTASERAKVQSLRRRLGKSATRQHNIN